MVAVQERKQQFKHRLSKMGAIDDNRREDLYVQQEISGKSLDKEVMDKAVVERNIAKRHPQLSRKELDDAVKSIILKPGQDIRVGNEVLGYNDYALKLAESIEKGASERTLKESLVRLQKQQEDNGKKDIIDDNLAIRVADLIEIINAGTSTQEEYFDFIETGAKVIKDMNDGYVSKADFDAKTDFIGRLDQREVELMRTISLYQSVSLDKMSPEVRAKFEEYKQKLYKLREVKSAVRHTTTNKVDEKMSEKAYQQAKPYWDVFREISRSRRRRDYDGAEASRGRLRILLMQGNVPDHEKMAMALHPYDKIRETLLLQELATWKMMSQNKLLMEKYDIQTEYLLVHNHENDTLDTVKSRVNALNKLRGISSDDRVLSKEYRSQLKEKQFYKDNFYMLQKQNDYSMN